MNQNDDIVVGADLPLIRDVKALAKFHVGVEWAGAQKVADLAADVFSYKVYAPLRDDRGLFESVHVVDDGNAIAWGPDDAITMSATAVERLAAEMMTADGLRAFMRGANLTRDGLAAQLGVSRRLVGNWLEGQAVPRYIFLACRALQLRSPTKDDATRRLA